jgi:hypothetical protein
LPQCHTAGSGIPHKLLCTGQVSESSSFFMHTYSLKFWNTSLSTLTAALHAGRSHA